MKFFLDCNHYSQLRVSFEGLKESTGFLNVRGFVRLKYRHSSHGVGWCSAGRVVLRHNHHPQVGADGERKRKRQSDAFLPYQDSTQRTRGDEALMEISRVTTTHSSHAALPHHGLQEGSLRLSCLFTLISIHQLMNVRMMNVGLKVPCVLPEMYGFYNDIDMR